MKQPAYTTEPLVDERRRSIRSLLLGHLVPDAYYEGHRDDNGVYILWMEYPHFGKLWAYPCVLAEKDEEPLVFSAGSSENDVLFRRWQELVTPESFAAGYSWNRLDKRSFRSIYRAYRNGEA